MKTLSPRVHGYLDVAMVVAFLLAPTVLGFGGRAASLCHVLAAIQLALTLLTAFPFGLLKMIPLPVHGGLEAALALSLAASPWLVGFAHAPAARNFFVASGVTLAVVWLLTDYRSDPLADARQHDEHLPV